MRHVKESFVRAATAPLCRGARHPALPWLGAGLWMMGCQAVPAASSRPGSVGHPTSTPSPSAGEAPQPGDDGRGGPPFVEIADGPCVDPTVVLDAEDATFLVSKSLFN
jgi:hypothetical protein